MVLGHSIDTHVERLWKEAKMEGKGKKREDRGTENG